MARTMHGFPFHKIAFLPPSITVFLVVIAILSLLSIVTFLCGSEAKKSRGLREEKTVRLGNAKKQVARIQSNISSKALHLAKMISWKKVQDEGEEEESGDDDGDDEEAVWRKTIIKGEKCRPLKFSGKILYDSNGNLIPDSPLPSKPK